MKKTLFVLALLLIVPFMTACGESKNKLTCVYEANIGNITVTAEFSSEDKLTGASVEQYVDFAKAECGDQCKAMQAQALENCKKDLNYSNCKIASESDKDVTIYAEYSVNALTGGSDISRDDPKEKVKATLEADEYKCE